MLVTSQIPITFVHQVYRETLLNDDDEDTNENDYVDIEVSTPCLQGYILSETSFSKRRKCHFLFHFTAFQ